MDCAPYTIPSENFNIVFVGIPTNNTLDLNTSTVIEQPFNLRTNRGLDATMWSDVTVTIPVAFRSFVLFPTSFNNIPNVTRINDFTLRFKMRNNTTTPTLRMAYNVNSSIAQTQAIFLEANAQEFVPSERMKIIANGFESGSFVANTDGVKESYNSVANARSNQTINVVQIRPIIVTTPQWADWSWPQLDPLAQTFFIDGRRYPNGIFVNKIDLFFKSKSLTMSVMVQIRPVVNGYPSSTTILPYGISTLEPSDILLSDDGTVPTTFEFENIIHLAPGEYSFVILANSKDYEIYKSILGDFTLINSDERVSEQPTLGSMFKSQNASAWTAYQNEDIKFVLYKCVFPVNSERNIEYTTDIDTDFGEVPFSIFFASGETVDFANTDIRYFYKTSIDTDFVPYQYGSNVVLDSTATLDSSSPNSLMFKSSIITSDPNITPIVDTNRLSNVLVQNIINNDATNENTINDGQAQARYITRRVKLNPGFEAADISVMFLGNKPAGTDIKVYYRVSTPNDVFIEQDYIEMELDSSSSYSESGYAEYKYKPVWDTAIENGDLFDTFSVKIVMLSSNASKIPTVRDLRVIVLDA